MATLRHITCGHKWQVSQELADRVEQDLNGGVGGISPPITCPSCQATHRYSRFEVVKEPQSDG